MRTTIVDGRDAVVQNAPVTYRVTLWQGDGDSLASTETDIEEASLWEVLDYIREQRAPDTMRVEIAVVHTAGSTGSVRTQLLGVIEHPSLTRIKGTTHMPSDFSQRPAFVLSTTEFFRG